MRSSSAMLLACGAALNLGRSAAFVHAPVALRGISTPQHRASRPAGGARPALSRLRMAKKGGGAKRKKKKAQSDQSTKAGSSGVASVADAELSSPTSDVHEAAVELEDAGGPMRLEDAGGPLKRGETDSLGTAAPGVQLADGVVGSDEAREAKIQETLKKLGVKSAPVGKNSKAAQAKEQEAKSVKERLNAQFDKLSGEAQQALEKFFVAGFAICLTFFVACGCVIGAEAYIKSTTGEMPEDLDIFLTQNLQPLFTPSLFAIFAFSISLGVLKIAQMGQDSVIYKEDD